MQNIPVKGDEGKALRQCFVARDGYQFVAADYSQIELRVAAMLSGDKYLQKTYLENKDVHAMIAAEMFSKSENEISKDERNAAKAMNFGIIYGMGVSSIQKTLKVERKVAQEFYNAYTKTVWTLMKHLDQSKTNAKEKGYSETLYGRRRNIPELFSPIPFVRASGERMAMNAPIQGTDADIIKWAMVDFQKVIEKEKWQDIVLPVLQIHDEILFEVKTEYVEQVGNILKNTMEKVLENHKPVLEFSDIPLVVNVKVGNSWGEM
jgi:DNA polymerase-1